MSYAQTVIALVEGARENSGPSWCDANGQPSPGALYDRDEVYVRREELLPELTPNGGRYTARRRRMDPLFESSWERVGRSPDRYGWHECGCGCGKRPWRCPVCQEVRSRPEAGPNTPCPSVACTAAREAEARRWPARSAP